MGVKTFYFCVLLTRPQKHALSEFQVFAATWRKTPLTITSGQRDFVTSH